LLRCYKSLHPNPKDSPCQTPHPTASATIHAVPISTRKRWRVEKSNVEEYCVSEGWIRVVAGNAKDRFGNPLTIKLTGKVEPYFKNKKPG